jgi:hypothetical protein
VTDLFAAPYWVKAHEHVDKEFAKVTLRCLGYSTHGAHPEEWSYVLLVPHDQLAAWPLGKSVRLRVT